MLMSESTIATRMEGIVSNMGNEKIEALDGVGGHL